MITIDLKKSLKSSLILYIILFLIISCKSSSSSDIHWTPFGTEGPAPKFIILFIGDGMGFEHIKAASVLLNGETFPFTEFEVSAQVSTESADSFVTDSAAAATAMATGNKVDNGVLSLKIPGDRSKIDTIIELYNQKNYNSGLVTTTYLTHATPAAFASHVDSRLKTSNIGYQYLNITKPKILLGGGGNGLTVEAATEAGYSTVINRSSLLDFSFDEKTFLAGLIGEDHLPYLSLRDETIPSLSEMTLKSLEILGKTGNPFFLLVESGRIDHASHDNNIALMQDEVLELNEAVNTALLWMNTNPGGLIIVTADHETGGLSVFLSDNEITSYSWTTSGHTEKNVPFYAQGNGINRIIEKIKNQGHNQLENTDIFIISTWGLE